MPTIFSRIISGELPCFKIAEDESHLAFLDISPLAIGHTLVIPKSETDYILNIADPEFSALWLFSKKVAVAVERVVSCKRIGIAVVGLEVPHAHIHLIPLNTVGDINFSKPKLKVAPADLELLAQKISSFIQW